jgi:3-hydroxybutyryl-CoA dehydrogenase
VYFAICAGFEPGADSMGGEAMSVTKQDQDGVLFQRVTVVGAGAMGSQIGMAVALSGRIVQVVDTAREALDRARAGLDRQMKSRIERGRMTQDAVDAANSRLSFGTDVDAAVANADLVIEAVVEKLDVKRELFARLGAVAPAGAVFASNSSSFVPSQMANSSGRPDRFVNIHFFNPALAMKCVEIIGGPATPAELVARASSFVVDLGKVPVVVKKEIPGFVANRILNAVRDESIRLLEGGVATISDIDAACRLALGHPMGPFELMDMTGLDIGYLTRMARFEETGDPLHAPSLTVSALVNNGHLGRKTGSGFYRYDAAGNKLGEADLDE